MLTETQKTIVKRKHFRVMDGLLLMIFVKERAPKPRQQQSALILSQNRDNTKTNGWRAGLAVQVAFATELCHAPAWQRSGLSAIFGNFG
jgi:hypothetical protein